MLVVLVDLQVHCEHAKRGAHVELPTELRQWPPTSTLAPSARDSLQGAAALSLPHTVCNGTPTPKNIFERRYCTLLVRVGKVSLIPDNLDAH